MAKEVEGDVPRYESATLLGTRVDFSYLPEKDRARAEAYKKYDQLYWNDKGQYTLRLLEGEDPVHIPNPKTIVDATAHFLLKGLRVTPKDPENPSGRVDEQDEVTGSPEDRAAPKNMGEALQTFLDREMFYARFQNAKHAGVARGDWCFHLTADPEADEGKRLSLTPVQPWKVILDEDPDDSTRVVRAHLVELVVHPEDDSKSAVKELLYDFSQPDTAGKTDGLVYRTETLWSLDKPWYDEKERELIRVNLPREPLPSEITAIPVYLFHNINWDGGLYGISELKGFENTVRAISQVLTDQSAALALEGLGVYATDGGAPVNAQGQETGEWEVAPGKVMEVPSGAYFRRVEGVGSVKPNMDHIQYLEEKIREAGGLSDVALGRVDVQTAESGIALAIKFMPTIAKTEERDELGMGRLKQLFFDWKSWHAAYEGDLFQEEIVVTIGDKLPSNRTERVNELNNMLDRRVISRRYYRSEMQKLGYIFPDDMEKQIAEEAKAEAELKALLAPPELQGNAAAAANGEKPVPPNPNQPGIKTEPKGEPNRSNNAGRPNESSGTEATQSLARQARVAAPQPATV